MSGLETNLKSKRPRPGRYETKTETARKRPRPRPRPSPENCSRDLHHCFTLYPAEYGTTLSFNLNNQTLPITKHPKTLEITFETKLTFSQYINLTVIKAKQMLNILKALVLNKLGK